MIPEESSSDKSVSEIFNISLLMGSQPFSPLDSLFTENTGFADSFSDLDSFFALNQTNSSSPPLEPFESKPGLVNEEAKNPIVLLPQPLECLQESPIPPFLWKTFDFVDDPSLDQIVSWGSNGQSFVVWDPMELARLVLPRNFKHNNFSSFVRQLNTYGFRKIDSDRWEFSNEAFRRGNRELLKNIQRRKPHHHHHQISEGEKSGLDGEVEELKNERSLLMAEVVELQRQHGETFKHAKLVNRQLESAEKRQKQMVLFLAKLIQTPAFLSFLKQKKENREIRSSMVKRRFLKQRQNDSSEEGQIGVVTGDKSKHETGKIVEKSRKEGEGSSSTMADQTFEGKIKISRQEPESDYYVCPEDILGFSFLGDENMILQEEFWGNGVNYELPFSQFWDSSYQASADFDQDDEFKNKYP